MHVPVLWRSLEDQWRALLAWTLGLVLLALTYLAFYPAIHSSGVDIQRLLDQMPTALRDAFLGAGVDYDTPTGYLGTELFAFLLPVILLVVAIVSGSRALAGEEGNGTIDLLLATPLRRRRLVVEKALASTVPLFVMGAAVWAIVVVAGPAFGITVSLGGLAVAILAVVLLAVGFGVLALLVAGSTGRRGVGAGLAGGLAVALYVLNAIGSTMPALQGPAGVVSPFHWSGGPGVLANGVEWSGVGALILLPVALLALAVLAYERRDLST